MALVNELMRPAVLAALPFGGVDVLKYYLTQEQIEYILLFGGFVSVVRPWAYELDLSEFGFRPRTPYRVFNSRWKFLYEVRPNDTIFGKDSRDLNVLFNTSHADYLHICFDTPSQPVSGLLWVANQISPDEAERKRRRIVENFKRAQFKQPEHEIFLATDSLAKLGALHTYFLEAPWSPNLKPIDVMEDSRRVMTVTELGDTLTLYPKKSGWVVFAQWYPQLEGQPSFGWIATHVRDLEGEGVNRVRLTNAGAYYLELGSSSLAPPLSTWGETNFKIRVEGHLTYNFSQPIVNLVGQGTFNIENG
jgi:hypothetical protein